MGVRVAKFVDIPSIIEIAEDTHENSVYGPISTFDAQLAKQLCARSMQRHGQTNYGGTLFLLSESNGTIQGFIIGLLDQVYPCVEELTATDLIFAGTEDMDPRHAMVMIRMLMKWAQDNPKVIEVHLGVTDALMGDDWVRIGKMYELMGLARCGGMYHMIIDRNGQEESGEDNKISQKQG